MYVGFYFFANPLNLFQINAKDKANQVPLYLFSLDCLELSLITAKVTAPQQQDQEV
jgi:hypothetical protein